MLEEKRNSTVLRQFWFVDVENTLPVFPVDALYHLCLFRIDDEILICILGVAEEVIVIYLYLAILVAKLESQLHILTEGLGFLLRKGSHNRNQNLTLGIHCIDGFLFKEDGNVLILQLADVFQAVQRVSGKSADGLGDNHVDVFGFAVANHPLPLYLR